MSLHIHLLRFAVHTMCAVTHHQCNATLILAKRTLQSSGLLLQSALQQPCVTAITPVEVGCLYNVCSDHPPMHCKTDFGMLHSPQFRAALQNRLTAALCHCDYICGCLLFIQVCSEPTPMLCSIGLWKMPPCSVVLSRTCS